jgi:gliding motility-associated-like protein
VLTATGGTSYEWRRDNVVITGQTKSTITANQPGTYSVIIKNGGCSAPASNTAVITLATAPSGTISPASSTICEGGSQVLTATGGTTYVWRRDGVTIEGQTAATLAVTIPGTYSVTIKNGSCSGEASNTSVVTVGSTAGSRYEDVKVTANVPTRLSARPIGITYEWSPGTGLDNPSSATPMVTINTAIQYLVRITPAQGCQVIDTVRVKVGTENKVFVPTAFTPNGNNVNDRLRPLSNLISIDYFRVYNRWGNLMFETKEVGAGWDGRYKGVSQPSDTYTWVLSGKTTNGEPVKQSGKTLLIR